MLVKFIFLFLIFEIGLQIGIAKGIVKGRIEGRQAGIQEGMIMERRSPDYTRIKDAWFNNLYNRVMLNTKKEIEAIDNGTSDK